MLTAAMVVAACGTRLDAEESAAGASGLAAVRPAEPTIAYLQIGSDPIVRDDRPAYLRFRGLAPVLIGAGQQFAAAGPATLLLERSNGHVQAYGVTSSATLLYERMNQGGPPRGVAFGDEVYEIQPGRVVATNARGATREVDVPSAVPGPLPPQALCGYEKIIMYLNVSTTWALAAIGSHLFAFAATPANGAIFDLTDGRRLDLPGSGNALAMAGGADGKLYAVTAEQRCGSHRLIVHRIDPTTMREESSILTSRTFPFVRIDLVSSAAGATYVHLVTDAAAELLRIEAGSVKPIALPPDSGLFSSAAPDGSIWLFGGRARNALSRFDPATGKVERVAGADAPDGAFVGAVIFPTAGGGP